MGDPFLRASRRTIRRLGKPIPTTDEHGQVKPNLWGIYDNPEGESLVRGRGGGLTLTRREHSLQVLTEEVPTLSKAWTFTLDGAVYFPAKWHPDGDGMTRIYLSVKPADTAKDDSEHGTNWR